MTCACCKPGLTENEGDQRHAIRHDRDMTAHAEDVINSLRIVLAADESVRTGEVATL